MKKTALFINLTKKTAEQSWLDQEVENPKTKNKVKVSSLPPKERERYRPKSDIVPAIDRGQLSVLHHPDIATTIINKQGDTALHYAAKKGMNVTSHPEAAKVRNKNEETPLHILSQHSMAAKLKSIKNDLLKHPAISKVKDYDGRTPLHNLAEQHIPEAFDHPDSNKVRDFFGMAPSVYKTIPDYWGRR